MTIPRAEADSRDRRRQPVLPTSKRLFQEISCDHSKTWRSKRVFRAPEDAVLHHSCYVRPERLRGWAVALSNRAAAAWQVLVSRTFPQIPEGSLHAPPNELRRPFRRHDEGPCAHWKSQ